jgi:hypothetical protein
LHTVANLPFYTVLRAALCSVNLFESEVRIVWVYGDFSATLTALAAEVLLTTLCRSQ